MNPTLLESAAAVRIYCPVSLMTLTALLAGHSDALNGEPMLSDILAIVRSDEWLGNFGLYRNVCEITFGFEQFMPTAGANPTSGSAGALSLSPTVVVTTFVRTGAPTADVSASLDRLMAAHPWEKPVIEICPTGLLAHR
jgi:hypothetical protein